MAIFNLDNPYERESFKEYCNIQYKKGGIVEVKRKQKMRTMAQNSYLHLLLGYFASEFGYSLDEVKYEIYKKTCNPEIYIRKRINKRGEEVSYVRSSTDLDRLEMTTSIERFRNYSSAVCGLYLPAANEGEALIAAMQQVEKFNQFI